MSIVSAPCELLDAKLADTIYAAARFRYEEVGSDSQQAFLIDGDSLLVDVLSHPQLDWKSGGQTLQLCYLLEKRLQSLQEADRSFHVVFFSAFEGIWINPTHQLAREIAIKHISTLNFPVLRKANWWSPEFLQWFHDTVPSFALVSSGKAANSLTGQLHASAGYLFQVLTLKLSALGLRCVRSTEASFRSHCMFGFAVRLAEKFFETVCRARVDESQILGPIIPPADNALLVRIDGKLGHRDAKAAPSPAQPEPSKPVEAQPQPAPAKAQAPASGRGGKAKAADKKGRGKGSKGPDPAPVAAPVAAPAPASAPASASASASASDSSEPATTVLLYGVVKALKQKFEAKAVSEADTEAAKLLILTAVAATNISVDKRSAATISPRDVGIFEFVSAFAFHATSAVVSAPTHPSLCDILDGNLLFRVRELLGKVGNPSFTPDVSAHLSRLWEIIESESGVTGGLFPVSKKPPASAKKGAAAETPLVRLARLDHELVKSLCGAVDAKFERERFFEDGKVVPSKFFQENPKWRPWEPAIFDDGLEPEPEEKSVTWTKKEMKMQRVKKRTLQAWAAKQGQRSYQMFISYMQKYAQSLKGGKIVLRDVVVAKEKDDGKGKKEKKEGAKAKEIRAKVTQKQREAAVEKVQRAITVASAQKTLEKKIDHLDDNISSLSDPMSAIPGHMQLLEWCVEAWEEGKQKGKMEPAVRIWQLVNDVFRRFKTDLEPKQMQFLQRILLDLGFDNAATMMVNDWLKLDLPWKEWKMKPEEVVVTRPGSRAFQVGLSASRFQLQYAGHVMMRNVDSAPDERVSGFYPDKWQRVLLDVVDAKESALIVAPTSAGKTFVSYYAMKQILIDNKPIKRSTDKGIIVYVSPSKALVNQVAADVYQRYGPVYGVYTQDWKFRVLECDVLITVPACLENMLLSPQREQWQRQIKYVIIDEIHTIGTLEGGLVQRILLLARAPFLALSATVGNPEQFYEWLYRIQRLRNRDMKMIVHNERWSDLEKSLYLPAVDRRDLVEESLPLDVVDSKEIPALVPVHPCAALSDGTVVDTKTGFPAALEFAPKDSLQLFDAMFKLKGQLPPAFQERVDRLHPDVYFAEVLCIDKKQARQYEQSLKDELVEWGSTGLTHLVSQLTQSFFHDEIKERIKALAVREADVNKKSFLFRHFLHLLKELNTTDRLPALVFCFERETCEKIVEATVELLEAMEAKKRKDEGYDEKKAKERKERERLRSIAQKAKAERDRNPDKESGKPPAGPDADQAAIIAAAAEEEEEAVIDPRFTFVEEGTQMEKSEYEWWVKRCLRSTQWERSHPLIRALGRGIGVHHAGLKKGYKDLVETLFRNKTLKVVVATETLALGVNMPCKTSVFALDHRFLTPLQYRQMAGRAGRRGYDNIGHVVFFGLPHHKAFRLMKSPLTSLQGHFPLTPTLALRMTNFYEQCFKNRKSEAVDTFRPLLQPPFCFTNEGLHAPIGRPVREEQYMSVQITHYMRFSFEFLFRQGLIDAEGRPIGMAGLVCQSFGLEPANFAFAKLLETGVIGGLCAKFQESQQREKVSQDIMLILCHLFNRLPVAPDTGERMIRARTDPTSSVILDPLPKDVQDVLEKYNKQALSLWTQFASGFSITELNEHGRPRDPEFYELPLSKAKFGFAGDLSSSAPASAPAAAPAPAPAPAPTPTPTPAAPASKPAPAPAAKAAPPAPVPAPKKEEKKEEKAPAMDSWEDDWEAAAAVEAPKAAPAPAPTPVAVPDVKAAVPAKSAQPSSAPQPQAQGPTSAFFKTLSDESKSHPALSPFMSLGRDAKTASVLELTESLRWGLWLDPSIIPVTNGDLVDLHGTELKVNAYAFDFYKNGRYTNILKDSGLKNADAWQLLKKWSLFLAELKTTLSQMVNSKKSKEGKEGAAAKDKEAERAELEAAQDPIVRVFNYLSDKFDKAFNSIGHVRGEEDLEL